MINQRGLQIHHRLRQLSSLYLRNSQSRLFFYSFKVWDCLGSIALYKQRISQQLMSGRRVRIRLYGMLQRRDRGAEVVLLHIGLAKTDEALDEAGLDLRDLSKLSNGNVELMLFVSRDARLHVLSGLRRQSQRCKPQN